MTLLSKLFSELFDIDKSKLKIIYVSIDDKDYANGTIFPGGIPRKNPVFWANYEDKLLYVVVRYDLHFLEVPDHDWKYDDGTYFNSYMPTEKELSYLSQYNFQYFIVDPNVFLVKENRDKICQWEEDIIKTWSRNNKLKQIFDERE